MMQSMARLPDRIRRAGITVLIGSLISFLPGTAPGVHAETALSKGKLLVASRELNDPNFQRTVILLTRYSEQGATGLVINRPVAVLPEHVLPEVRGLAYYRGPLFLGGPVETQNILFLIRTATAPTPGRHVFGQTYLSGSRTLLDALSQEAMDASRLRVFAGYAGWAPGQLEQEILRGGWHVVPATEELVVSEAPESVWEMLVPLPRPITAGLTRVLLAMAP
jgi:putative transcriptional regulator